VNSLISIIQKEFPLKGIHRERKKVGEVKVQGREVGSTDRLFSRKSGYFRLKAVAAMNKI